MDLSREHELQCEIGEGYQCDLDQSLEVLRQVPVFAVLPMERLMLCAYMSKHFHFKEGDLILLQGSPVELCHIIISGKALVFREYEDHLVPLHELQEFDILGGLAFLPDLKHIFSVKALTDVECLTLEQESFRKIIQQFPEMTVSISEVMFKRILQMVDRLLESHVHTCVYRGDV